MATVKHVIIRLYLYLLLILFFFTGGLAMFLLVPLYKSAFAPQSSYSDFDAFRVWAHVYKVMWRSLSSKGYRDLYPSKITDPPMFRNDASVMRIKKSWSGQADNCGMCENSCCAQINCPLLGKTGGCLGYSSIYFGYFYCGRYPNNQGQVDLYDCPKWEVCPEDER